MPGHLEPTMHTASPVTSMAANLPSSRSASKSCTPPDRRLGLCTAAAPESAPVGHTRTARTGQAAVAAPCPKSALMPQLVWPVSAAVRLVGTDPSLVSVEIRILFNPRPVWTQQSLTLVPTDPVLSRNH